MIIFSHAPYSLLPFEVLRHIQSSAHSTWQPRIRTLLLWSGSIPSEFATSRSLSILICEMRTSLQPAGWRVQNGASTIVIFSNEMWFDRNYRGYYIIVCSELLQKFYKKRQFLRFADCCLFFTPATGNFDSTSGNNTITVRIIHFLSGNLQRSVFKRESGPASPAVIAAVHSCAITYAFTISP